MEMLMNNLTSWSNDMRPVKSTDVRQHKNHKAKHQEMWVGFSAEGPGRESFTSPRHQLLICGIKNLGQHL